MEIIWFNSKLKTRYLSKSLHVYGYIGGSANTSNSNKLINKIADKPKKLLSRDGLNYLGKSISNNFSASAVAFGVWVNRNKFTSYKHYEGKFSAISGSFKQGTVVTAWSDNCKTVGVGYSTEGYGVSYASTRYKFWEEKTKKLRNCINYIQENVKQKAKKA